MVCMMVNLSLSIKTIVFLSLVLIHYYLCQNFGHLGTNIYSTYVTSLLCAVLPAEVRVPRGAGGLAAGQAEAHIQGE